jgi:hypothetical protein
MSRKIPHHLKSRIARLFLWPFAGAHHLLKAWANGLPFFAAGSAGP